MKRLALVGLLGLAGCIEEKPAVEPDAGTACNGVHFLGDVGSSQQAMRARDAVDPEGREPVLVRYKAGSRADEREVLAVGGKVKAAFSRLGVVAARLTPAERAALARNPEVASIGPDRKVHALGWNVPPVSYLLQATPAPAGTVGEETTGVHMVQAPQVWDANGDGVLDVGAPTGAGIKVCIVDSGIDRTHPELLIPYVAGIDFVDGTAAAPDLDPSDQSGATVGGGHGTHVAGTIAAQFSNAAKVNPKDPTLDHNGVIGVAPGAQLLIARVLDTKGNGDTSDVIAALDWCTQQKANIITLSLGSEQRSDEEELAFAAAADAGVLTVAATGNSGTENPLGYPAGYNSVMAVGAVEPDGGVADFSQHFPTNANGTVDVKRGSLVAPGTGVQSTMIRGHGTSYTEDLTVGGASFDGEGLEFSPLGAYSGVLVDCGIGDSDTSCGQAATCAGFVAYVERGGGIFFKDKAKSAIKQGAKAIIFGNNKPEDDDSLGFTLDEPNQPWVPSVAVTTTAAAAIKGRFGSQVSLSLAGSDYAVLQGTSMATPHVSAVAALVWSARPSLSALEVRKLLEDTALDLGPSGYDKTYGYGLVQAKAALDELNRTSPAAAPVPLR